MQLNILSVCHPDPYGFIKNLLITAEIQVHVTICQAFPAAGKALEILHENTARLELLASSDAIADEHLEMAASGSSALMCIWLIRLWRAATAMSVVR